MPDKNKKAKHNIYIVRNGKKLFIKPTKSPARAIYEHVCMNCDTDFISNRPLAKFCSDSCRVRFWQKCNGL